MAIYGLFWDWGTVRHIGWSDLAGGMAGAAGAIYASGGLAAVAPEVVLAASVIGGVGASIGAAV